MREKVFATSFFYYGTDDRTRNTITAKVVTRDEVDGDCLIRAVKSTEQRYPYLKLKTGRNINRYLDRPSKSSMYSTIPRMVISGTAPDRLSGLPLPHGRDVSSETSSRSRIISHTTCFRKAAPS